ncbi:unnamed protein product [Amoebophrya sp. A25]|nr:unnamed protein product [Amoebophrya sp. A25]|eukprot:GSA25T00023429001.1
MLFIAALSFGFRNRRHGYLVFVNVRVVRNQGGSLAVVVKMVYSTDLILSSLLFRYEE